MTTSGVVLACSIAMRAGQALVCLLQDLVFLEKACCTWRRETCVPIERDSLKEAQFTALEVAAVRSRQELLSKLASVQLVKYFAQTWNSVSRIAVAVR